MVKCFLEKLNSFTKQNFEIAVKWNTKKVCQSMSETWEM